MIRLRDDHTAELYRLCENDEIMEHDSTCCCSAMLRGSSEIDWKDHRLALIRALPIPNWAKAALGHTYRYWFTPAMCVRLRTPVFDK